MQRSRILRTLCVWLAVMSAVVSLSPARAEQPFLRTPDTVRDKMNQILSGAQEEPAAPFAELVDFDDAGGFDFCAMDGERMLASGEASAFVRGRVDSEGRVDELVLTMTPRTRFGREFGMHADRLSRVCMLSVFDALNEGELQLLMDSYLYDIRPYHYRDGDRAVVCRERMCEIELQDEVVRIESSAGEDNALSLTIAFLYDADETTRGRARENAWRIRRLAQAVSECEMIQTCGECLLEIEEDSLAERAEEARALTELAAQSAFAVGQMETQQMHSQETFLLDLQERCARLSVVCAEYAAAQTDPDAAWQHLQEICRISLEIGRLPETLY